MAAKKHSSNHKTQTDKNNSNQGGKKIENQKVKTILEKIVLPFPKMNWRNNIVAALFLGAV